MAYEAILPPDARQFSIAHQNTKSLYLLTFRGCGCLASARKRAHHRVGERYMSR